MKIASLQNANFDDLFKAFSQAFSDYEMHWSKEQLKSMLNRRGFIPELSFAAFEKNEIVAFTLNGIGLFNNKRTAYDTGTGTVKEFRGQGLATKIFEYSVPYFKEEKIEQYILEVLKHNSKAVSIYKKVGFTINRELNYFMQSIETINNINSDHNLFYEIKNIELKNIRQMTEFWDFHPSWQNSFDAINRNPGNFIIKGAFRQHKAIGYFVLEPKSGDITQIAVDKQYRRKGVGSLLLKEAVKSNQNDSIKIINTDVGCLSITEFLKSKNILIKGKQLEMIKKI